MWPPKLLTSVLHAVSQDDSSRNFPKKLPHMFGVSYLLVRLRHAPIAAPPLAYLSCQLSCDRSSASRAWRQL